MFGRFRGFEGSLFDDFRRVQQQMDELFGTWAAPAEIRSLPSGSFPAINVGLTPEKVDVYLFAAGCDPKSFDISLHKSLLTVSGRREVKPDSKANYYRQERFGGEFRRAVTLPEDVDPDQVQAGYCDGVLHVSVKRREASRPRQIQIQ